MINKDIFCNKIETMNDTFEVRIGDVGTVEVRKHINGGSQEAMVHLVAQNMLGEDGYHPLRKNALILALFLEPYVIGGAELKAEYEDGSIDIYGTYAVMEDKLRLMATARSQCETLDRELARIENAVDLTVFHAKDEQNAVIAGGMATTAGETMDALNALVTDAHELVTSLGQYWAENQQSLAEGMEQIAALNQKLGGVK